MASQYRHCFVRSYGWFASEYSISITMEYIPHGDLQRHLTRPLPEAEAIRIIAQVNEGLGYMHENSFIHRDLKPGVSLHYCRLEGISVTEAHRTLWSSILPLIGSSKYPISVSANAGSRTPHSPRLLAEGLLVTLLRRLWACLMVRETSPHLPRICGH